MYPPNQVGGEPAADGQKFTYAVRAQGRLRTPEEFGDIIVRENADGRVVRVKDVARVELGSQDYSWITRLNGQPSAIIGIYQVVVRRVALSEIEELVLANAPPSVRRTDCGGRTSP